MNRKIYNKLVRNRIPEIIRSNKGIPTTRELADDEFLVELKAKLQEEALEVTEAASPKELLNELSDVLEIVEAIAEHSKLSMTEVKREQEHKKKECGGFSQKIYLEHVDEA